MIKTLNSVQSTPASLLQKIAVITLKIVYGEKVVWMNSRSFDNVLSSSTLQVPAELTAS